MNTRIRRAGLAAAIALALAVAAVGGGGAQELVALPVHGGAQEQTEPVRFLGLYTIAPKTLEVDGTTVGGLSGITYDARRGVYYLICDDRSEFGPARFYTVALDIGLNGISGVRFLGYTALDSDADTPGIQPYDANESDMEEIVLLPDDTLIVSSERDRSNRPWLRHFALDGTLLAELPLPDAFVPESTPDAQGRSVQTRGIRTNFGFEGVTFAPDESALYAINEESLAQDGPIATTSAGTLVRLLRFSWNGEQAGPGRQMVYRTDPIFTEPVPAGQTAENGVSSLLWIRGLLPQFDFLTMERAFATGTGNDVTIYGVTVAGADDVAGAANLPQPFTGRTLTKTPLVNMAGVGVRADNLEGLTLGPRLADGRTALIVLGDDNFNDVNQIGQFLLFEIGGVSGK